MAQRVYNSVETKADLYGLMPADGQTELLMGDNAIGDIAFSFWQYDANSSATDNFVGGVVHPAGNMGNGRWLRRGYYGAPTGTLHMWSTGTAPGGFLICDGSAVSRTTYVTLFGIIGTTFGVGDGSTTFNLPDFRQRFPLGVAASGTGNALAATGGSIDHVHTANPPSTGSSTDGSHNHGGATGAPSTNVAATNLTGSAASTTHTHSISTDGSHSHTVDIASFDTGTANPPFLSINFIIKF